MLAFAGGDASAFERLFQRWAKPLLRYLERLVGDNAVAEELVQDSFLRLHRARDRYRPDARFSTWLYTIATNTARNELRRPFRRHPHDAEAVAMGTIASRVPAADTRAGARLEGRAVLERLELLPDRQREALLLVAEGLSYAEIAEAQGSSVSAVKASVHRARSKLADRLAGGSGR
ncbi:MAG: sigma-70 family RNA polymerase sigma factor [Myxococcales bacterium]|nr:sigma-70 family RNA polymerase sigma factor [Myxococcales bacterium]